MPNGVRVRRLEHDRSERMDALIKEVKSGKELDDRHVDAAVEFLSKAFNNCSRKGGGMKRYKEAVAAELR